MFHLHKNYDPEENSNLTGYVSTKIGSKLSYEYYAYFGLFYQNSVVLREGKWAESKENVKTKHYPPYMNGCAGHIISRSIFRVACIMIKFDISGTP